MRNAFRFFNPLSLVLCLFVLRPAPLLAGEGQAPAGADFAEEARMLWRVAACGPGDLPAGFEPALVERHCVALRKLIEDYRKHWVSLAGPFLAERVPADAPSEVVYPFGGGDLLSAMATFPKATTLTVLSLETAGDVRAIRELRGGRLRGILDLNRRNIGFLFRIAHSKTTNLSLVMRGELPGQLIFALVALVVHGQEPVSLRYFHVQPDGTLRYVTQDDIAAAGPSKAARTKLFANVEVQFRPVGGQGPVRTYRHISANLDDSHLRQDPGPVKHLEAKGRVAAMTKAASYLLWWGQFSTIRDYLLTHVEWMVSDSTGIPPEFGVPAGFEYETWGRFAGPFLPAGTRAVRDFRSLWRDQPRRELPFRYGYPDSQGSHHLLVTRRVKKRTP